MVLNRLQQRKFVQWLLAYLAMAWLLLQVVALLGDKFGWPPSVFRILAVLAGAGLLAVAVLAWYHGERGAQRVTGIELLLLAAVVVIAGFAVARFRSDPRAGGPPADAATPEGDNSLAVLPFVDMSPEKDQEYFSDGITEEILNALAKVDGLRVPARTSSFAFKGKNQPVSEIAAALQVRHVLEGSVRKAGSRVKITAQLIDPRVDRHLWSDSYERDLADVFAIQEEIARAIVQALRPRLGLTAQPLVAQGTENIEAYNLFLQAHHFWNRRNEQSLRRAISLYKEALRLDPTFARAHAAIAEAYLVLPAHSTFPEPEARKRATEAVQRALAMDSTLALARVTRASLYDFDYQWSDAEREFKRAIELDPSYATTYHWFAMHKVARGRATEALELLQRARQLDPLSTMLRSAESSMLLFARRIPESVTAAEGALAQDSTFGAANLARAELHIDANELDRALHRLDQADSYYGGPIPRTLGFRIVVLARKNDRAGAKRILRELEALPSVDPVTLAIAYDALGRRADAFAALNRGADRHVFDFAYSISATILDPLRQDPRFSALRRRIKLE